MALFSLLILPIHENRELFPSSSIFLSFFLWRFKFSLLKSFTSLLMFMPRYFQAICEQQYFYDLFLSIFCYWFKNVIRFCKLILYPETLLRDFILSKFLVEFQRSLINKSLLSPREDNGLLYLKIGKDKTLTFSWSIGLVRDSSTILKQRWGSNKPSLNIIK